MTTAPPDCYLTDVGNKPTGGHSMKKSKAVRALVEQLRAVGFESQLSQECISVVMEFSGIALQKLVEADMHPPPEIIAELQRAIELLIVAAGITTPDGLIDAEEEWEPVLSEERAAAPAVTRQGPPPGTTVH